MALRVILLMLSCHNLLAQTELEFWAAGNSIKQWGANGSAVFNFSNVHLKNWAGGGERSLSLTSDVSYSIDYQNKEVLWDNDFNFIYGQTRQGDQGLRKKDDQLTLHSLFGRRVTEKSTISFLLEFRTQIADGFDYYDSINTEQRRFVSEFLAPGYLNANIGW